MFSKMPASCHAGRIAGVDDRAVGDDLDSDTAVEDAVVVDVFAEVKDTVAVDVFTTVEDPVHVEIFGGRDQAVAVGIFTLDAIEGVAGNEQVERATGVIDGQSAIGEVAVSGDGVVVELDSSGPGMRDGDAFDEVLDRVVVNVGVGDVRAGDRIAEPLASIVKPETSLLLARVMTSSVGAALLVSSGATPLEAAGRVIGPSAVSMVWSMPAPSSR